MSSSTKSLIINSPYDMPRQHWGQDRHGRVLEVTAGRRLAGYEIFDTRTNTRRVEELELVNRIRPRVDEWRVANYPGVTSVTRRLLEHWHDREARQYPFYFCQLEAIETLIWWVEAPADFKQGIYLPSDGGPWERVCNKMATGAGKTTVMGLVIAWQVLNALTYPKRKEFSPAIFVVAPGLTVKERLQVLYPGHEKNVYDEFNLCPNESMRQKINQAALLVENWHALMPLKEQDRSVVKKGAESDEAFTRRVLGKLAGYKDLVILNDEAHHAYRQRAEVKVSKKDAEELGIDLDEATRWIEGLDRIHKTRRIRRCFDLTATPFAPTGKKSTEKGLFEWIVSDFGLNDAIEAGLVKTPRVVVRDDALANAQSYKSKLYHLYNENEVKEDLNRKAESQEPLPDLVQKAYALLAYDWRETAKRWAEGGHTIPPVILTVCNRTESAARIERFFNDGECLIAETQAPERTLRVDSRVLEKAERGESITKDKDYAQRLEAILHASGLPDDKRDDLLDAKQEEQLRAIVDTVGKRGKPGQHLQNVISVAMLSEGWDAANVTHIMGLRAFTSQLLCEQVIGRGLRRVSYEKDENGLFLPEYVNVFGVPLSIFQDVGAGGEPPPPPKPSVQVEVVPGRNQHEIRWPNVLRIDAVLKPELVLDWDRLEALTLDPVQTPIYAEVAPALAGQADLSKVSEIDLEKAVEEFRLQNLIFRAARKLYQQNADSFPGDKQYLAVQLIRLVDEFLVSDKLRIPSLWHQDPVRRRILIAMNMDTVVGHVNRFVQLQNTEKLAACFDQENPIGSTGRMRTWYTTKPCAPTARSQISHAVYDSVWEKAVADLCEKEECVVAWAKNDHLDFKVRYLYRGSSRNFVPDYLIRLNNSKTLVLEVKGQDSEQNRAKRAAMQNWVQAINEQGGFGQWCFEVVFDPAKIRDAIYSHLNEDVLGHAASQHSSVLASPRRRTLGANLEAEKLTELVPALLDDQSALLKDPRNVPVWFGTNRAPLIPADISKGFSDTWGKETTLGRCVVNVPEGHVPGSMGSTWWVRLIKGDDRLKVVSIETIPDKEYWLKLSEAMREKPERKSRDVLFFLHGYNVSFEQAAKRTAQLAYDLRIHPAVFFSWPSGGAVDDYAADEATIEASYDDVTNFVARLDQCALSAGATLHVLAHSMGNRALLKALEAVAQGMIGSVNTSIDKVVFAAPDVDARVFMQSLGKINSLGNSKTLYASKRDKAVWLSKALHKFARAGLIPPVTTASNLDTIDAAGVDDTFLGHGYIASVRALIADLSSLLKASMPPEERVGLEPATTADGKPYWRIK